MVKLRRLSILGVVLVATACAGPARSAPTPGNGPTATVGATAAPSTIAGPTLTVEPDTATLIPSSPAASPTVTRTPIPTPTLAVATLTSNPNLPGYIDVLAFGTSIQDETLTAVFRVRDLPGRLAFDRTGTAPSEMEYAWCALVFLDGRGSVKGSKPSDYQLCAIHFVPQTPSKPSLEGFDSPALQVNVWRQTALGYSAVGEARLSADPVGETLTLVGRIAGITKKALVLFDARDALLGERYSR